MAFLAPQARGEHAVLTTFALQQLGQLRTSVVGLSDAQAHSTPSAAELDLTGLLLHAGRTAVRWAAAAAAAPECPEIPAEFAADRFVEECVADDAPLARTLEYYDRCVARTADLLAEATDLDAQVPVPAEEWFPDEIGSWDARWAVTMLIAELARHAGHADIVRESIDGKGSYELNELADAEDAVSEDAASS